MKLRDRINSWGLKRKISFFMTWIILTTFLIILAVSTVSTVYYITEQSKDMATSQLETLASNYDGTLEQYQNVAVALVIDSGVQAYCKSTDNIGLKYEQEAGKVYNSLLNMINVQNNMNFAVILKTGADRQVYKGNSSIIDAKFNEMYEADYKASTPIKDGNSVQMSFSNNYFRNDAYTLTLYHPIYSTTKIGDDKGMLVMNLSDNLLEQLHNGENQSQDSNTFLMDMNGKMVSIAESNKIGDHVPYIEKIEGNSGSFRNNGTMINYQRVGNWNYYLVNEIPVASLYSGSIGVALVLVVVILLMTFFTIMTLQRIIHTFYKPIEKVVAVMDNVAEGKMDIRIDKQSMDADSKKLAEGFNAMMNEINVLMEQIKTEQHQMDQIRFNALQSQIQPHFLYNTLECIHWQAVADGKEEISTIVKAMAQYYRVCLSRGKEIITLKEELGLISSYLTIQNMRYDNIVELNVKVPEELLDTKIPKMTLQPLIENAIYHGIRGKGSGHGTVTITAYFEENDVHISVADSGTGMTQDEIDEMNRSISVHDESFGYGVRNVNKRIEIMFGEEYGLLFHRNDVGGVTVEIHLPKEADVEYKGVL